MPFALVIIGILLVVVGFQNTYKQFGTQVQNDFTGDGNFIYWIVAIGVVGALGYAKPFETFSRVFMALIIIVLFLSNKGFFNQFSSAIKTGTSTAVNPPGGALPAQSSSSSSSTDGGGSDILSAAKSIGETLAIFGGF